MLTPSNQKLLIALAGVLLPVGYVVARMVFDISPAVTLAIMVVLAALLAWQLGNRSQYRRPPGDLHLR